MKNVILFSSLLMLTFPLLGVFSCLVCSLSTRRQVRCLLLPNISKLYGVSLFIAMILLTWAFAKQSDLAGELFAYNYLNISLTYVNLLYFSIITLTSILFFKFSTQYLQEDRYYLKFYTNIFLFFLALSVLALTNSLAIFYICWEILGITSVFLICYYQNREAAVKNSFRTLVSYKIGDLCLFLAILLLAQNDIFYFSDLTIRHLTDLPFLLLIIAAAVKSAQYPFCYWLPRAMEGPTPTSSVFYGALSVHTGVFLLFKLSGYQTILPRPEWLIIIGIITLVHTSIVGRTICDIKKVFAYASCSQIAIMFIEIGLGFPNLALLHFTSHIFLRFFQLLQTPSALHRYHLVELHNQKDIGREKTGVLSRLLSEQLRTHVYHLSFDEGKLHFLRKALIVGPWRYLVSLCSQFHNNISTSLNLRKSTIRQVFYVFIIQLIFPLLIGGVHIPGYINIILAVYALTMALSLFATNRIPTFFANLLMATGLQNATFLSEHLLVAFYLNATIVLTVAILIRKQMPIVFRDFNNRNFLGLFDTKPTPSIVIFTLLLIMAGIPFSPIYFVQEQGAHFYLEHGSTLTTLYFLTSLSMSLAIYRFIFLTFFGRRNAKISERLVSATLSQRKS